MMLIPLSFSQDDTRMAILQFQKTLSAKFTKDSVGSPRFAASSLEYIFWKCYDNAKRKDYPCPFLSLTFLPRIV